MFQKDKADHHSLGISSGDPILSSSKAAGGFQLRTGASGSSAAEILISSSASPTPALTLSCSSLPLMQLDPVQLPKTCLFLLQKQIFSCDQNFPIPSLKWLVQLPEWCPQPLNIKVFLHSLSPHSLLCPPQRLLTDIVQPWLVQRSCWSACLQTVTPVSHFTGLCSLYTMGNTWS